MDQPAITEVSSAAVQAELVQLRARDGMTMRKLRDACPALRALNATTQELNRRSLAETDRHVAAYEMLKCSINSLVPRTDFARVLAKTLNVGGSDQGLEQRRRDLCAELYLSDKAFRRVEDDAYTHLAGVLVGAERSPCDGLPSDHLAEVAFDLHVTTTAGQLLQVLTLLSWERRGFVRDLLGEKVLEVLPEGRAAVADETLAHLEGPWQVARHLIGAICLNAWPPRANTPTTDLELFSAASMSDLFLTNTLDADWQHQLLADADGQRFQHVVLLEGERPTELFYQLKGRSLLQFGAQMERVELDEAWPEILGGVPTSPVQI